MASHVPRPTCSCLLLLPHHPPLVQILHQRYIIRHRGIQQHIVDAVFATLALQAFGEVVHRIGISLSDLVWLRHHLLAGFEIAEGGIHAEVEGSLKRVEHLHGEPVAPLIKSISWFKPDGEEKQAEHWKDPVAKCIGASFAGGGNILLLLFNADADPIDFMGVAMRVGFGPSGPALVVLMTRGAVLTARSNAGDEEALMTRKLALTGTEKTLHCCHSNAVLALLPSFQTSVLPRPSTTT